jgi:hypothetical protein
MSSNQDPASVSTLSHLPATLFKGLKKRLIANGEWSERARSMFTRRGSTITGAQGHLNRFFLLRNGEELTVKWYPVNVAKKSKENHVGVLVVNGPSFPEPWLAAPSPAGVRSRYYVWLCKDLAFADEEWDVVKTLGDFDSRVVGSVVRAGRNPQSVRIQRVPWRNRGRVGTSLRKVELLEDPDGKLILAKHNTGIAD